MRKSWTASRNQWIFSKKNTSVFFFLYMSIGLQMIEANRNEVSDNSSKEKTTMSQDVLPITGLTIGGISPDVIVCGDPDRATKIAGFLDDAQLLADLREYRSFLGHHEDLPEADPSLPRE